MTAIAMFTQVIGHRRLLSLLSRAIARDTLPPALLLAGPSGVGKRRVAMAIARAVNCLEPQSTSEFERDACGKCAACRRIERGVHPDVIVIEPGDTGTIKIEAVRDVVDRAGYRPFEGRRRVVIIDEADALVDAGAERAAEDAGGDAVGVDLRARVVDAGRAAADGAIALPASQIRAALGRPKSHRRWCAITATRRPTRAPLPPMPTAASVARWPLIRRI